MAVHYKNTDSITLGNGFITWGTTVVTTAMKSTTTELGTLGLLLGDVTFNYTVDMLKLEAGIPIMLVKQAKRTENASITAEFCEFDALNLRMVTGLPTIDTTVAGVSKIPFGGAPGGMDVIDKFAFTHVRPDGKVITVFFHKAAASGSLELSFSDGAWSSSNVTFEAIADFDQTAGSQLGYISIASIDLGL